MAIRLGDAEEDADHLHRQLRRDLDEEVDRLAVRHRVEQRAGTAAQLVLQPPDGLGRQSLRDEPANPAVARVVHHVEHDARDRKVLDQRAAVRSVAAPLGRVGGGVGQDPQHLFIRRDRPEALAVGRVLGRLVPPHRCRGAVPLEEMVREARREVVEVGEVDPVERRHARGP